jgi:hypothetical protein
MYPVDLPQYIRRHMERVPLVPNLMKVGNEFQIGMPNVLVTRGLMFGTLDVDIVVSNYTRTVGDIDDRKKIQRSNDVIRQLGSTIEPDVNRVDQEVVLPKKVSASQAAKKISISSLVDNHRLAIDRAIFTRNEESIDGCFFQRSASHPASGALGCISECKINPLFLQFGLRHAKDAGRRPWVSFLGQAHRRLPVGRSLLVP